jgi:hypothetical protein
MEYQALLTVPFPCNLAIRQIKETSSKIDQTYNEVMRESRIEVID